MRHSSPTVRGMKDVPLHAILRNKAGEPLPNFSTAAQIGEALQVTARTVLLWEAEGKITASLRQGRTVRFNPAAVVQALGIVA